MSTPKNTSTPAQASACCDGGCSCNAEKAATADAVRDQVREGYSKIAESGSWAATKAEPSSSCCAGGGGSSSGGGGGGCCGGVAGASLAEALGYSESDLAASPESANMGLSCGNPTALASLKPGETVLDLGSGGGFDAFVAGPRVGPTGRIIGVDMTPAMLSKARANLPGYREHSGLDNVEFRLGEIEHLPIAAASVDVVISNCVLNLSPDKPQVWREIARILKPGGRVAVSDLALLQPLPEGVMAMVEALIGCIAGAVLIEDTRRMAAAAGLTEITLTPKPRYIEAMTNWEDPLYRKIVAALPAGSKPSDYITSLDIAAQKPAAKPGCCS